MKNKHRIAFAGFRHPHIFALLECVKKHPDCEIVAAYEGDTATRESLPAQHGVKITHTDFDAMLEESDASIVAIGDVYAKRGALAIAALRAGKHIISDKPICTSLQELEEIRDVATATNLSVGCQLDLVENSVVRTLCDIVQKGIIGRPCTITIGAQHPLRLGVRAAWYFEPGQHGGTINDIGIHIFDFVPWMTGQSWKEITLAREWNAKATDFPHFKDCAQFHLLAQDGLACFADVSYLAPDALGYGISQYWRITVHGTNGMAETFYGSKDVTVITDTDESPQNFPGAEGNPNGLWQDFIDEIEGHPAVHGLTTARVLESSRWALKAQNIASKNAA